MKTLVTKLWLIVFAVFTTTIEQGICQQAIEPKPPTEVTATGLIKTMTLGSDLILSVAEGSGLTHDMTIILPKEVKIIMDENVAKADDLRIGQMVTVTYTTENTVPIANNIPAGETTVCTAKSISIIFGNNSSLADIKFAQRQTSVGIPADFIGSWVSAGVVKTEKMQITTNSIRWTRNVLDPRDVYDSNSNKLNINGDVSFDVKVLMTTDVFASTTVTLKARDGKLFMKVNPSSVDLGYAKISDPGEERMYFRDRTPNPLENKP